MEAKETVMSRYQLADLRIKFRDIQKQHDNWSDYVAEAQAEISFAAGKQDGIKQGRREVLQWILSENIVLYQVVNDETGEITPIDPDIVEAKLKEWGLNASV